MEIENKNNIEVVSDFEYFFTWADFTNILNNNTVPCDFLKEDGEYVNVGEIIFRLDLIEHFAEIAGYIDITKEGHIIFRNRIRLSSESEGKLLYAIRKNDNDRIARKFINVPEIKKDEFSGNKTIRWRTIGGHTSEKICSYSYENGIYFLDFGFNFIDNKDYIVFHSNPKQLTLSKDDTISFLLENKEIIEFKLVSNSYKVGEKYRYFPSEGYEKVLENKLVISDAELLAFETHKLIQWKIKIKKDFEERSSLSFLDSFFGGSALKGGKISK